MSKGGRNNRNQIVVFESCHQEDILKEGKICENVFSTCLLGEEMVVLPPLLHPHLRDGGLRGPRPPVISLLKFVRF